jgi:hypothetical protein
MAQKSISIRKDLVPAESAQNKSANLRIQVILNRASQVIPLTIADGSTVSAAKVLSNQAGFTVTNVFVIKTGSTGGSTDAVQLCTDAGGTTAVSSSFVLNSVAAGTLVKTTVVNNGAFAAGATLYVKRTKTTDCSCTMIVEGYST